MKYKSTEMAAETLESFAEALQSYGNKAAIMRDMAELCRKRDNPTCSLVCIKDMVDMTRSLKADIPMKLVQNLTDLVDLIGDDIKISKLGISIGGISLSRN